MAYPALGLCETETKASYGQDVSDRLVCPRVNIMSPIALSLLAVGLSVDAFIASVGHGSASLHRPGFRIALRTGLIFGVIEMVTPLIGWGLGMATTHLIAAFDHWIAFGLLALVGGRMIYGALLHSKETPRRDVTGWVLVATAIGTSVDALAVGVSMAYLDVDIILVALAVGLATTVMATSGMLLGRKIGQRYGKFAEALGGVVLIGLGSAMVIAHLAG